jgi:energy-coupling factor transport system substrate-specific component
LTTVLGVLAFLYPFLLPALRRVDQGQAHATDAPLVLAALVGLCLLVLLLEVQSHVLNAKVVALLGILISMNAVLRFVEVAIPGPAGSSTIFFLILLTGYVYGGRFGFLMGALSLLAGALITGGVGPWLPYQMFTAGWIGMSAPLCRRPVQWLAGQAQRREVILLAVFGALWGFIFGAIMNLWFWPFASGPTDQFWTSGTGVLETVQRYVTFYLATSLVWDAARVAANVLLILTLGVPTLRALRRFQRRFIFHYTPVTGATAPSEVN